MVKRRKKILYLCPRVPYPPDYGYPIRALNVGKILSSDYEVDLLSISAGGIEREQIGKLHSIFNKVIVFEKKPRHFLLGVLLGLFRSVPIQVSYYYFRDVQSWVDSHCEEYDLVLSSTIRMAEYARRLRGVKKALDFIDSISLHYQLAVSLNRNVFWSLVYRLENSRLLSYERNILRAFGLGFIASGFDREHICCDSDSLSNKLLAVPNGVNPEYLQQDVDLGDERTWVLFLGKMDYSPNEDAVVWFSQKIWPGLEKKWKGLRFMIVGKNPSKGVRQLNKVSGVKVTGFVKDPLPYLLHASVFVVPLRFGAGIQNKVLEAMALGKAVVTTPVGVRGIPEVESGKHAVVVDIAHPSEMIDSISNLLDNKRLRHNIGLNARQLVRRNYTWAVARKKLLSGIKMLLC